MKREPFVTMRKLLAFVSLAVALVVAEVAYAQTRCGSNICIGSSSTALTVQGAMTVAGSTTKTTCTLNAASPAVCTATVTAGSQCYATTQGVTAAAAKSLCVSLSGTTVTVTAANGATDVVNILCL